MAILRRVVFTTVKGAVCIGLLVYIAIRIDVDAVLRAALAINGWFPVATLLQMMLIPVLGAIRWHLSLSSLGYRKPLASLLSSYWIGMAFNQVLPSTIGGDALRVWMLYHRDVDVAAATTSLIVECGLMLLSLLLLALLGALLYPQQLVPPLVLQIIGGVLAAAVLGIFLLPLAPRILKLLPDHSFVRFLARTADGARQIVFGTRFIPLFAMSMVTNLNLCLVGWWLVLALGLPVSFVQITVIILLVFLATIIPISIGGWGVREGGLLGQVGVANADALLCSVLFGLAQVLASLPGLALLWWEPLASLKPERDIDCARA